jgi:hypothetical protein
VRRAALAGFQRLDVGDERPQLRVGDDAAPVGIDTIGARLMTLPLLITSMIFWSVLSSLKKSAPESVKGFKTLIQD